MQAVYTAGDQRGVTYGSVSVLGAYVFYAAVPVTSAKTVQAVTLPRHGSGPLSGIHIFAVGIGPLQLPGTPSGASD